VLGSRGWMNVIVPYPAWAMKKSEADFATISTSNLVDIHGPNGHGGAPAFPLNLPDPRTP